MKRANQVALGIGLSGDVGTTLMSGDKTDCKEPIRWQWAMGIGLSGEVGATLISGI